MHTGAYGAGAWRRVFQICGAVRPGAGSGASEGGISEDPELLFFQYRSFHHIVSRYEAYQRCDGDSERGNYRPPAHCACTCDDGDGSLPVIFHQCQAGADFPGGGSASGGYPVSYHQPCEAPVFPAAEEHRPGQPDRAGEFNGGPRGQGLCQGRPRDGEIRRGQLGTADRIGEGLRPGMYEHARHAVRDVCDHRVHSVVWRQSDFYRRNAGRGTYRILKLCASGPQFPDDDLQCLHDGDPVHGLRKTYSGSPG